MFSVKVPVKKTLEGGRKDLHEFSKKEDILIPRNEYRGHLVNKDI